MADALGTGSLPAAVLGAPVTLHRFYVGSREAFAAMLRAVSASQLRPVIGAAYALAAAGDAYRQAAGRQVIGKVVITG